MDFEINSISTITKFSIKTKLAELFEARAENISVYDLTSVFGGGIQKGTALIYDSLDAKKEADAKFLLIRDHLAVKK